MRVIADLVMNHTSADHPWFHESRTDPTGPYGDWYVWGDDDTRWSEARVIFLDTEPSNWTWDPVRGQYYWHRFFSHQPDLNYDNPEVQEQMLNVLRFWLDLGLDGFRLDAVPYLYERDGTNGENLPETHAFLRRVRAEVDARYSDRVLLAEANQWPADVVQYFGDGDECHMAFHFPVMPRMFMAIRREDALPMVEILESTPPIPDNAQWGLFLRNHDELTLEMVTDDERDYLYEEYAKDPRMKLNLGIRRRLAPLLDNGRDEIQLMHAILFSLPGSPVLYYGDEIGMGDNIFLGRSRRRAHADAVDGRSERRLLPRRLPAALSAAAHGPGVRLPGGQHRGAVAAAELAAALAASPDRAAQGPSGVRARHLRGAAARRTRASSRTCAPTRTTSCCASTTSRVRRRRSSSTCRAGRASVPEEMFGRTRFPRIGELPYLLTMAPRGFFWFQRQEGRRHMTNERQLIEFVTSQRWYASKTKDVSHSQIVDRAVLRESDPRLELLLVEIRFDTGMHETYQLLADETLDALTDPRNVRELVSMMREGVKLPGADGIVEFAAVVRASRAELREARPVGAEQSNTSIVFDDELILKVFRRLEAGINPELELLRFLTEHGFENIAQLVGWYSYAGRQMDVTLGILQRFVDGRDGWEHALDTMTDGDGRVHREHAPSR